MKTAAYAMRMPYACIMSDIAQFIVIAADYSSLSCGKHRGTRQPHATSAYRTRGVSQIDLKIVSTDTIDF